MSEAESKLSGFLGRETFSYQHFRGSGCALYHAATRTSVYWLVDARFIGPFTPYRNWHVDIDCRDIARPSGAI